MLTLHKFFAEIVESYEDSDFYKSDDGIFIFFGCIMSKDLPFICKGEYVEHVIFNLSDGTISITEKDTCPTYIFEIKPELLSVTIQKKSLTNR